jgi:mevalonate kinase
MGSGAAVTVAILRALSAFWGNPLNDEQVSGMAYEVEKIHHGTPSGIDNHVVTYAMPVYFRRGHPVETFRVPKAFEIVIGNTGITSPTAVAVGDVRKAWQSDPNKYNTWFDEVSAIVESAREAFEAGQIDSLGPLMDHNHALLQQMQVSSPELDRLVEAARAAGAPGAKLSGGGRGGNMIALVKDGNAQPIIKAIQTAGGTDVLVTRIR